MRVPQALASAMKPLKICAIVVSKEDPSVDLSRQTRPPDRVVISREVFPELHWVNSLRRSLVHSIEQVLADGFTYLLRVNGDVVLPDDWIEDALGTGADVVGRGGSAILFRPEVYRSLGGWPQGFNEDSTFLYRAAQVGYRVAAGLPTGGRPVGLNYSFADIQRSGFELYRMGYTPVFAFHNVAKKATMTRRLVWLAGFLGYARAVIQRPTREIVAPFVFRRQLTRLLGLLKGGGLEER